MIDPAEAAPPEKLLIRIEGTPDEIERTWYEKVYKGRGDSMLQLTWRAIIMGSFLGALLSLVNLYIGLKAGWGFGVAITACILSYAIWTTLYRVGLVRTPMTILENNCMQSTASAAGYSTGGTLVSAIAAFIMVHGHSIPTPQLMAWVFFLAILGVTMAIPMKRQMINVEQLPFPDGTAAAETLRALHATGSRGMRSAKALLIAGGLAALSKFLDEGLVLIRASFEGFQISSLLGRLNERFPGATWTTRTVAFAWDPIFIAAGAITGMRACASMFGGAILCWMIYVPALQAKGIITSDSYKEIIQWTLWGGATCMVTSGLLSFFMQWRTALRAFADLGKLIMPAAKPKGDPLAAIETPASWFLGGQIVGTIGLMYLAKTTFDMPYWLTFLAVALSFALALVACRVCGETNTTPVGPMGKVAQLTFGAIRPGNMSTNLMAACITAGAADSASDLLMDLRSGYLLGASPRKQFIAQFAGIFAGTLASVIGFNLVVTGPDVLGTAQFPAPSALTWAAVAEAMGKGLHSLEPLKVWSIVIGGSVGILLPVAERVFPKYRSYVPSAAAVGLSWTFAWYLSALFFTGAVLAKIVETVRPKWAEEFLYPVASGVIAGGSLMGVAIVFIHNGPSILRQLFGG